MDDRLLFFILLLIFKLKKYIKSFLIQNGPMPLKLYLIAVNDMATANVMKIISILKKLKQNQITKNYKNVKFSKQLSISLINTPIDIKNYKNNRHSPIFCRKYIIFNG